MCLGCGVGANNLLCSEEIGPRSLPPNELRTAQIMELLSFTVRPQTPFLLKTTSTKGRITNSQAEGNAT